MTFISRYVSHKPDSRGFIPYSSEEQETWRILFERQKALLPNRACKTFIAGLERLGLTQTIPQLPEISEKLKAVTGWQVQAVDALISARAFFTLLADRKFPAATFIRRRKELNYVQEPDIFHELFGHCPMLTDPVYADFVCDFAKKVLTFSEDDWPLLQRLFWFTVEFGLIQTDEGLRAYGGGILSSINETVYSLESDVALRVLFEPVAVFRTPYRIDQLQSVYFVIDNYQKLFGFVTKEIGSYLERARQLKEFPPLFVVDADNPNIHILAC